MSAFVWIGGRPSLDLCNTAAAGAELLAQPDDVVAWLVEAGLGTPERPPAARDLERVRHLRTDLRTAFLARDAEAIADIVADWLRETPGRLAVDRTSLRPSFCPEVSTCRCLLVPALLDALEAGRIGGAGLDVFEGEPAINPRFAALGNVLLQPHVGSATTETRRAMGKLMLDNLVAHFEGRALLTEVV